MLYHVHTPQSLDNKRIHKLNWLYFMSSVLFVLSHAKHADIWISLLTVLIWINMESGFQKEYLKMCGKLSKRLTE